MAEVTFIHVDEMERWEAGKRDVLPISAGFWERQAKGELRLSAPEIGYAAPLQIPPGEYFILVHWEKESAASRKPVLIPEFEDAEPLRSEALDELATRPPDVEFQNKGRRSRIRFLQDESREYDKWERIDLYPGDQPTLVPPVRVPISRARIDKVDPFVDLTTAIPAFVADIRSARRNIWMAWWTLTDDFPTQFNAAGAPIRFLRDEIRAALVANPRLHVFILIWNLNGFNFRPTHARWRTPATANRLHIAYHGNFLLGSHHQKFLLCDLDTNEGAVLWCRGWDGSIDYWDLHAHGDPDPYLDVNGNDHQPWHDSALRIVSKRSSRAFENEFHRRWPAAGGAPPLPPAPPPTFNPNPVGTTIAIPKVHIERRRPRPQENWYRATIPSVRRGLYFENQYLDDRGVVIAAITRYLVAEVGPRAIHGVFNICHPKVMSPPVPMPWRARNNVALTRAMTARLMRLRVAGGLRWFRRPPGGWANVAIRAPWPVIGRFFHVTVAWPGGGAAGKMERARFGISCLTMATPSATAPATFRPIYLHSKFAVMDDQYMLGSTNISRQSFAIDSETDVNVPDSGETTRATMLFFTNLVAGTAANLPSWLNRMAIVARSNYDMEKGVTPWAPVGLLTEFPYE
jgi:phosphatidylserine/phosphatidylglycerophosphate/cardiolipin synthase-like enzyme